MSFSPVINGQPIPQAELLKVYHQESGQWFRALRINGIIYCPQMGLGGYDWGFKFLGRIQGFTRCQKCSAKNWLQLTTAPNPY